jgi:transposase
MAAPLFARPPRDAEEERKIRKLAGARHALADGVLRARMITASWAGKTVSTIAAELGCKPRTVRMRLHRFNAEGLDGPGDQPIPGRPPRLGEADRSGLIGLVKQPPPGRSVRNETGELVAGEPAGAPEWTLDALAAAAQAEGIEIHRSQVRRILLAEGVRWRRTRSWTKSKDPDFVGKGRGSSPSAPTHRSGGWSCASTSSAR